jgi:sulfate adenylyltransferase subunit 2
MSNRTIAETLSNILADSNWHDLASIEAASHPVKTSRRQLLRELKLFTGDTVSSLEEVTDGQGRPLKANIVPHLKDWIQSKRFKVRILQINEAGKLAILEDFRGHQTIRSLESITQSSVVEALNQLTENLKIIPHALAHQLLQGTKLNSNLEIIEAAHYPLPFVPSANSKAEYGANSHLKQLERESIHIIREAVAAAKNPAMLFSLGKDSMVMLRLAEKAFAPEKIPFPLVNIDTQWKFQEMNTFREWIKNRSDFDTIHYINPEAIENNINPFDQGSALHTEITKTKALKQILEEQSFDFVFGGARRDEEKSRAKERVFSVRDSNQGWDPRNQRPELWNFYNTTLTEGQSMRVFPLSNWTELDIWRYLQIEDIPLVPLYFATTRPFVERNGALIMVDDERFRLEEGEKVRFEKIRFRSLGCYPLSGGVLSDAGDIGDVISELETTRVSERSSRVIDFDRGASMEQKKKDGYF